MTKLTFSQETLLPPSEFQAVLRETLSMTNPLDDLLELAEELRAFEQQHGMSSATFFVAYESGELPEPLMHNVAWAATYDMFVRLKRE